MLIKVLSTFLVIQFFSFAFWQGSKAMWQKNKPLPKPATEITAESATEPAVAGEGMKKHEAATPVITTSQDSKATAEHVLFAAKTLDKGYRNLNPAKKSEIVNVLQKLPGDHIQTLKNIVLDYNPEAHRGLGGRNVIILRAVNMETAEFVGVLVHEIGHNVDLGHLSEESKAKRSEFMDGKKPVYVGDPSLDFYRISWKNDQKRKKTASSLDFVSGYAMTDPFEDFAESYVYYVLHNKDFKSKAQTSNTLLEKYNFIKYTVFGGGEFDTGEDLTENLWHRPWDITVLSYDLQDFLVS